MSLASSGLQPHIQQLHDELKARGLVFMPPGHVGDEWFVPVGIPAIFIPFFLVHDRLRKLERKLMLEVEGETPEWFMKLMRHEAAHAYSNAYRLQRKKKWQATFGLASKEDTGFYRPRPYSRSYVLHFDDWYAEKRKLYEDTYPDFYNADLRQLFTGVHEPTTALPASAYLRRHRRALVNHVCQWTNERKYRVDKLLARLIHRCEELDLFARANDAAQAMRTAAYIATLVQNYLFTGKFKRRK